jgi:ABC-type protease/lipase transport system fused ATPase/permease subunit
MHIMVVRAVAVILLMLLAFTSASFAEEKAPQNKKNGVESAPLQQAINRDKEMINMLMQQNQPPRQPDPVVKDVEFEITVTR